MNVKGGVAYIDFKNNDLSAAGSFVLDGIYDRFNKAYNSKKTVILANVVFYSKKLCYIPIYGIREKSASEYVIYFRIPYATTTSISVYSRGLTISSDDTVTVVSF